MLTLAVKCERARERERVAAAHNINKSVPNGPQSKPFTPSASLPAHILASHEIKFAPESMQRKRWQLSQVRESCKPPGLLLSLSLSLPGLQLIMSKLAITATLAVPANSLGRRSYAWPWLPKNFRAAKLIYKFPARTLSSSRGRARSTRCHMLCQTRWQSV